VVVALAMGAQDPDMHWVLNAPESEWYLFLLFVCFAGVSWCYYSCSWFPFWLVSLRENGTRGAQSCLLSISLLFCIQWMTLGGDSVIQSILFNMMSHLTRRDAPYDVT